MKNLKKTFFALLGSSMILSGCSGSKLAMGLYNEKANRFEAKNTRLDEKVINRNIKDFDLTNLQMYVYADFLESRTKFKKIDSLNKVYNDSIISANVIRDLKLIAKVDTSEDSAVTGKYPAIKAVTKELDSLYDKNPAPTYERLNDTYIDIGEGIDCMRDNTGLSLEEMLSGKGGVCIDEVSAYCPLLLYYGFDVGFELGKIAGDTVDSHTWLHVILDNNAFDVDPTWYANNTIPLKPRLGKSSTFYIPKKDIITRGDVLKKRLLAKKGRFPIHRK